jgi:sugar phosphate permease
MHDTLIQVETHRTTNRFYRWELLALLCGAFFLHQGDRAIYGVVLSSIRTDLGLSDGQLGMVGFTLFITIALMMPVAGYLGDIWSRRWIITGSVIFWSGATMLTGLTQGVLGLVAFRSVATAGGESMYAPAAYPLMAAYHKTTRALAMSIHQAALYVGVMTSGFLGGAIAQQWGWRSAFYMFGGVGVFLGLILIFRLKDAPPEDSNPTSSANDQIGPAQALAVLFRTPSAVLLTVGFTAIVIVNNAYMVWAPAFVEKKFGLSVTEAGGYSMLYHHLAAMAGVLVGGRLSDVMAPRRRQFRLELQTVAMLLGVPAILWMGLASNVTATWVAMAAVGLFRGLYESNTHASLFDVIAPRYRASAVGAMVMTAFLIGSVPTWLLGYSESVFPAGQGLSYGIASLSAAYLVGGLAVFVALKKTFLADYCGDAVSPAEGH